MKETLNVRYARFPQISVMLNMTPIGTIARLDSAACQLKAPSRHCQWLNMSSHMYVLGVIGTLCLESSVVVNLAMYWVMIVPKTWCHVVKKRAGFAGQQAIGLAQVVATEGSVSATYGILERAV